MKNYPHFYRFSIVGAKTLIALSILAVILATPAIGSNEPPIKNAETLGTYEKSVVRMAVDILTLTGDQGTLPNKVRDDTIDGVNGIRIAELSDVKGEHPAAVGCYDKDYKYTVDGTEFRNAIFIDTKQFIYPDYGYPVNISSIKDLVDGLSGYDSWVVFSNVVRLAEILRHENIHNQQSPEEGVGSHENMKNCNSSWIEVEAHYAELSFKLNLKKKIEEYAKNNPKDERAAAMANVLQTSLIDPLLKQIETRTQEVDVNNFGSITTVPKHVESPRDANNINKVYKEAITTEEKIEAVEKELKSATNKRKAMPDVLENKRKEGKTQLIDPNAGGKLILPDGHASVSVPAGSLPSLTNVELYELDLTGLPAGSKTLSLVYELCPVGMVFNLSKPAYLAIKIIDPNALYYADIYVWNPTVPGSWVGRWELITNGRAIDPNEGGIQVAVEQYGHYVAIDGRTASEPDPVHGARDVNLNPILGWTPGKQASEHDVYFGTIQANVDAATTASPEYKGRQSATTYNPGTIALGMTYYWRIDEVNTPLAEVWKGPVWCFTTVPGTATYLHPANGLNQDITSQLVWTPGPGSTYKHDVYLGIDLASVTKATPASDPNHVYKGRQDPNVYAPAFELGKAYYWRIDEIDQNHPGVVWTGPVWSFTTNSGTVWEPFDEYADAVALHAAWQDDADRGTQGNGQITLGAASNVPADPTYNSSTKSMIYAYDNTGTNGQNYSEVIRTFATPQDWTVLGVKALVLFFYGTATNAPNAYDTMWCRLEDNTGNKATIIYGINPGDNMNDIKVAAWKAWNLNLANFTGVNKAQIKTIAIGFGVKGSTSNPGTNGTVHFDEFRLYIPRCIPAYVTADLDGDCTVDYADLSILAANWLQTPYTVTATAPDSAKCKGWWKMDEGADTTTADSSGHGKDGTLVGNASWITGKYGNAVYFDGDGDVVLTPALDFTSSNVTMTCWVKPTGGFPYEYPGIMGQDSPQTSFNFVAWSANLGYTWSDAWTPWNSGLSCPSNVWTFIGLVVTPTQATCYMSDGVTMNSATEVRDYIPAAVFTDIFAIGSGNLPYSMGKTYFQGAIDDARVYSYALSEQEIVGVMGISSVIVPLPHPGCDIYPDLKINFEDFAVLAGNHWLEQANWPFPWASPF